MPTLSLCLDSCSIRFCGCSRLCVLVCDGSYINDSLLAFVFTFRIHVLACCARVSFALEFRSRLLRMRFICVSARVSFALAFRSRFFARVSFALAFRYRLRSRVHLAAFSFCFRSCVNVHLISVDARLAVI